MPPLDHSTGAGYVAAHPGHYADALAKGNQVVPLICETLGGLNASAISALRVLASTASPESHRDGTQYGLALSPAPPPPPSSLTNHLRLISLAIHVQNMELLLAGADRAAKDSTSPSPRLFGEGPAHAGAQYPDAAVVM